MNRLFASTVLLAVIFILSACTSPSMKAADDLLSYELLGAAITVTRVPDAPDSQHGSESEGSDEWLASAP